MGYTHGIRWTDEKIKAAVLKIVQETGINRMPSRKECSDFYQSNSLASAITKRHRWYDYAKELNLSIKDSETKFGKGYEQVAYEMLSNRGYIVDKMPQNFPYDLLVNRCIKVDVKASNLYHGPHGNFYTFNLEKPFVTCDFFLLLSVSEETINRVMVVPSNIVATNTQISVGEHQSKYHKFTDRFDLIDDMCEAWSKLNFQ